MPRPIVLLLCVALAAGVAWWMTSRTSDEAGDAAGEIEREPDADAVAPPRLEGLQGAQADTPTVPLGPEVPSAKGVASIRLVVHVVVERGETPLEGATVTVERDDLPTLSGTTDALGTTTFTWTEPGEIRVFAVCTGYVPETAWELELEAGEQHELTVGLEPGVATYGLVVRADDDRPVAGAQVYVEEGGEHAGITASGSGVEAGPFVTDSEGRFVVPALLPIEIYTFSVVAPGYARAERALFPRDASSEGDALVLRLHPGGRLTGRVYDPEGRPVRGATVQLDLEDAWTAKTDADGHYLLDGLTFERPYGAIASAPGLADSAEVEGIVTTDARPETVVDLTLRRLSGLVLRLVGESQAAVTDEADISLGAWPVSGWQPVRAEGTPGAWSFIGVDPGDHRLQIQVRDYRRVDRRALVTEGETTELVVTLKRGAVFEGTVVDDRGEPVAEARVEAQPVEGGGWEEVDARTDEKGYFRMGGLAEKAHRLRVWASGHDGAELKEVVPPRSDVLIELTREATIVLRLKLPAGAEPPGEVWLGHEEEDGGSGTGEGWQEEPYEYALPPGRRLFELECQGFVSWSRIVDLAPGERKDFGTILLDEGIRLAVTVEDLEGRPVPGAAIAMGTAQETWRIFAPPITGRDGKALVEHLHPGAHEVSVEADGFLPKEVAVEVAAAGAHITVRLARGGLLRVRVLDRAGVPVKDARVFVECLDPRPEPFHVWGRRTDELGWMETREEPGRYRAWIGEQEAPTQTTDVVLEEGGTQVVVLRQGGS